MKKITFALVLVMLHSVQVKSDYFDCIEDLDYDYIYDYPEVIYFRPEQLSDFIDILKKSAINGPATIIPFPKQKNTEKTSVIGTTRSIEETTTTVATTTYSAQTTTATTKAATIPVETTTTSTEATTFPTKATVTPTEAATTIKIDENTELEDPVEDVNYVGPIDRGEVSNAKTINKITPVYPPEPSEIMDTNDYDNDYERDSQEDILSYKKKPEKMRESTQTSTEDDNNSKPKNVYSWFRL